MLICWGIFLSADRFPDALQPGASQAGRLRLLVAGGGLSLVAGLRLFRWN